MAADDGTPPKPTTPQSIPLQDLSRPPDTASTPNSSRGGRRSSGLSTRLSGDRRSLLGRGILGTRYERIQEDSPTRRPKSNTQEPQPQPRAVVPRLEVSSDSGNDVPSPVDDLHGFATATAAVGLSFENRQPERLPRTPSHDSRDKPTIIATFDDGPAERIDNDTDFSPNDTDTTPLRDRRYLEPTAQGSAASTPRGQRHDRQSKRGSIHWLDGESPGRTSRLGDDLPQLETGLGLHRKISEASGISRLTSKSGDDGSGRTRSLSPGAASPMSRANSMLRMMSQRVVNLSNDSDMVEQSIRRKSSVRQARLESPQPPPSSLDNVQDSIGEDPFRPQTPIEKQSPVEQLAGPASSHVYRNPLKGKSLGVFGPENTIRKMLCETLVHPVTEPIILILIVAQTVLLAIDAAPSVYHDQRSDKWGNSRLDYALFALFVLYTLELIARIIVSGFILNPSEYSTIDRSLGIKKAVLAQGERLLAPERRNSDSARRPSTSAPIQQSIIRSFTGIQGSDMPGHERQQQRIRLARRAVLRHSFNRLDLVAVVSFWIAFALAFTGIESSRHIYVFRMLSCLRILRLLGLTSGTTVILRSLKKAAPLLVNVAFLITFFWLLFAIVGVQSFKSSLRRTCVWLGPDDIGNYTQNLAPNNVQFCGGYIDATTGLPMPWLTAHGQNGTTAHKGHLCPQGSLCVEGQNPYNGTVSFDNIFQSLELVFVVMSANTFSDLLYYLADTDYLAAALFFAASIVVMTFWLINLLIAVITSSFQIIREESKRSAFTTEQIDEVVAPEDDSKRRSRLKTVYDKTYWFWIVVIAFGLVVQCQRRADMGDDRRALIMDVETVVTLVLLLEIILRFLSDWRSFFHSRRNWFDLGLAIITAVCQIPPVRNSGQVYAWLSFFQIARIYRVVMAFRLTRDLIMVVFGNIGGLLNLIVFVFLLTFLGAILASQLFRGELPAQDISGTAIRITFFDIYNSFIGMYQILSSENWTTILYSATQYDVRFDTAWLGSLFFIMWFVFANFIVLNMFIAVIQESFDVSEDEKRLQQVKQFLEQKEVGGSAQGNLTLSSILKLGRDSVRRRDPLDYGPATMEMLLKDAVVKEFLDEHEQQPSSRRRATTPLPTQPVVSVEPGSFSKFWGRLIGLNKWRNANPFYSQVKSPRAYEEFDPRTRAREVVSAAEQRRRLQRQYLVQHPNYNVSLFIFKQDNPLRNLCQRIVGPGRGHQRIEGVNPWKPVWYSFSAFLYAAIVAMVLLACVTTPLYQREYLQRNPHNFRKWFVWTDLGFAVLFSLEAIIKVIADGFYFTPNAYFRSTWGFIDALVLVTLWIDVITSLYRDDNVSRAVGAFKALRALRLLNVSDSARDTFYSVVVLGGSKVLSAAFVSLSLLIPFAIFGLNLFNGQMESCNDSGFQYNSLSNCVGEYLSTPFNNSWTVLAPRQVSNPYYNFDNFGSALFILFQIVSQEGWVDVMWSAMSTTGKGNQPQALACQGNAIYFIMFNLLASVFVLTLFISVFMRNYTEQTGVAFLTAEQRSWLELRKLLKQISPSKRSLGKTSRTWQKWCYRLAVQKHGFWQRFITTVLLLHLTMLIIEFYPSKDAWDRLRDYIMLVFTCIYIINIFIRIIGLSWKRFRGSAWDVYSVLAVTGTLATSLMALSTYSNRTFDQLHKLFLVSITFLLIPRNNQLDQLFKTAAASLTSIANLLATWFVLFLVYAIAFTQAFGLTRFGAHESGNLNFRDVPKSLILLFRMSCGEGWNQIMEDFATIETPLCVLNDSFFKSDCGSAAWARTLFVSWNIISMYIFVSLFVSLIFESFSYVYQRSSGLAVVSREEIRRFKQAWSDFDPNGTGYISKEEFPRLLGVSFSALVTGPMLTVRRNFLVSSR